MKYSVLLFKNKSEVKVLKRFEKLNEGEFYFDELLKTNQKILFPVKVRNARVVSYEVALVGPKRKKKEFFTKDEIGRNKKLIIADKHLGIYKISPYRIEERIYDVFEKKRIGINEFIDKYLGFGGIKMISKLNHKLIIQEDDKILLFSLKSQSEAGRFLRILQEYLISNGRIDVIAVRDMNRSHRRMLYDLFKKNNLSIKMLYRRFTTHKPKIAIRRLKPES